MFYLGVYKSKASREKYNEIIAEFLANGQKIPPTRSRNDITVQELAVRFLEWAGGYYVKVGEQTSTYGLCKLALSPLVRHYGNSPVSDFGPLSLVFLHDKWIEGGTARETINRWCGTIKQAFKWGVARELVAPDILHALQAVDGLKSGRTKAEDYNPIDPVADAVVDRTLPELSPIVRDMVQVQRLAGMRPQDVRNMRSCDIDRSGDVWVYKPFTHKNKHRKKVRIIAIGPRAQAILTPYLVEKAGDPEAFLFSPKDTVQLQKVEKRRQRKSKVQPSQVNRSKANPKRKPKDQYDKNSYNRAIFRAINRFNKRIEKARQAGVNESLPDPIPYWSPNQLRHTAGTEIRNQFGLDVAQAVLGHSSAKTTEIYAELDFEKAAEAMRKLG